MISIYGEDNSVHCMHFKSTTRVSLPFSPPFLHEYSMSKALKGFVWVYELEEGVRAGK